MKKFYTILCGVSMVVGTMSAQELQSGDISFPNPQQLATYVNSWNSTKTITMDGVEWEDEEFFTSRVKPRERTSLTGANIHDFGDKAGRRMLYWVPLGNVDTQGLPNGKFDSEAFSTWSYLDHYGSFTSPYGWVAGAFADAAHKNGVAVSGIASVPQAIPAGWSTALSTMGSNFGSDQNAEKLGKFLYYHGTDGLAYNSEWSGLSPTSSGLLAMHNGLMKYMADKNPIFENIWYDGTTDTGGCNFDSALNGKLGIYKGSSIFSNYNWNNTDRLNTGVRNAESVSGVDGNIRGPWWNYAGCNYEGGEPAGTNYTYLPSYKWSVGYWGAHSVNMIWAGRNGGGSSVEACQLYYQHQHEMFFGNGKRNPAIPMNIINISSHRPNENFHGASAYINERSSITHNISSEPFYTFFNLGNGRFFNWKGERMNNDEWYSLGIQDFMPTWRWWFAPTWLQKSVTEGSTHLSADFTYEDAYVGGSCLKIEGTTTTEYLHLFKTDLKIANNNIITVRYKLLEGEADVRLIVTKSSDPGNNVLASSNKFDLFTTASSEEAQDQSYQAGASGWIEKKIVITMAENSLARLNKTIGAIGLEFKNAKNMKMLLGEISVTASTNTATPAAPKIRMSKVLRNNHSGIDGKIIWTMDDDVARQAGTPKYNSDVNASMYRVWAREEGGEAKLVATTTSWAAMAFRGPNTDPSKKIQFGVSAVSADTKTESAITWGELLTKGDYVASNDIQIDKKTIKKNEGFEISYVDPRHSTSNWVLKNSTGATVASATNSLNLSVPSGLSEEGGYDLVIDEGTADERTFGYYVQITSDAVGALPQIYTLSNNDESVDGSSTPITIALNESPILSYTGRKADGQASRANALNGHTIGAEVADLGLAATTRQSFSVAGWYKINEIPQHSNGWNFVNVCDKLHASWPINEWGWSWNSGDSQGRIKLVFRGNTDGGSPGELHYLFPDLKIQANAWTHIALVIEYQGTSFRCQLYVNGVKQKSTYLRHKSGGSGEPYTTGGKTYSWYCTECENSSCTNTGHRDSYKWVGNTNGDEFALNQTYALSEGAQIFFGGPKYQGAVVDGIADDFQIWDKAMTEEEVKQSMKGYSDGVLPEGLLALWDFETEANSDGKFISKGKKQVALSTYDVNGGEGNRSATYYIPLLESGCPFLTGTAFPIVTTATWDDALDRKTEFDTSVSSSRAVTTVGESGAAKVIFKKTGDHEISLTLKNDYGSDTKTFPVYKVGQAGIDDIEADGSFTTYTVDKTMYLEFAEGGDYDIDVVNTAGMLAAHKSLNVVAGQTARIDLGVVGIYLVKVVKDGRVLRTLKIAVK